MAKRTDNVLNDAKDKLHMKGLLNFHPNLKSSILIPTSNLTID